MAAKNDWLQPPFSLDEGIGARGSIGVIGLSSDRIGVWDLERFIGDIPGVAVFSTRVPIAPVGTPETLRAVREHLTEVAGNIVTGSRLDVIGLSCTSASVAIGLDNVRAAIQSARPGVTVATPIEAGAKALRGLGATRISLLTPYLFETADLISGFFEASGFTIDRKAAFNIASDTEVNAVTADSLVEAARSTMAPESDALFLSCTGLRTSSLVERLEAAIGRPVVTSNQALAWDCLRACGRDEKVAGQGTLFRTL